jgi:hypothetical protein
VPLGSRFVNPVGSAAAGCAAWFPRLTTEDAITEASVLPRAVLDDERTARFTGGGGGGRVEGHGAPADSAPWIIDDGRDWACREV